MSFALGNGRESVLDDLKMYEQVNREELELYQQLTIALDLMQDNSFVVDKSDVTDGIHFVVLSPYPDGLPEKVGALFFNVSTDFDVKCKEFNDVGVSYNSDYRNFNIEIKKY